MVQIGSIVKSKSGHDSGSFYVVVSLEGEFAYIADGRRRKREKPKRKNLKHLARTNAVVSAKDFETDKQLRRVLWDYNFGPINPVAE